MISGHSIIYFGPEKWEGMWRNRHHLMSRFARCNKVMYVEPAIGLRKLRHQILGINQRRSEFWGKFRCKIVSEVANNLYIYHSPIFTPISGRYPLGEISWWAWRSFLKLTMVRLGFSRPIIWVSRPNKTPFIGALNEKLIIYHVVDEYLAYGNMDSTAKKKLKIIEQQMAKMVDMIIVVSESLKASKGPFNKFTYKVPNGVDYESYDRALSSADPMPDDIARLPRPILGYSGLISRRLDLGLLKHIAIKYPKFSIALIGTINDQMCKNELCRLRQMDNVYFLGLKEIKHVPYYIKAFDVCLIPYRINQETRNLDALKLYDFLAAGKPIVTTDFPAAREFKDVIYLSNSKDTFIAYIEKALCEKDHTLTEKRRQIALQNTWDHRVNQISRLIEHHLDNRMN